MPIRIRPVPSQSPTTGTSPGSPNQKLRSDDSSCLLLLLSAIHWPVRQIPISRPEVLIWPNVAINPLNAPGSCDCTEVFSGKSQDCVPPVRKTAPKGSTASADI